MSRQYSELDNVTLTEIKKEIIRKLIVLAKGYMDSKYTSDILDRIDAEGTAIIHEILESHSIEPTLELDINYRKEKKNILEKFRELETRLSEIEKDTRDSRVIAFSLYQKGGAIYEK